MSATREDMVRQLRRLGVRDERVLGAMAEVPREEFVRPEDRSTAYEDHALPIAQGQTISQPYIVARMTELLDPRPTQHVLEVGTGSGYQAAVLSRLVRDVVSVERHEELADAARDRLRRLGYENVRVIHDDASLGYPAEAPYDRIVVTAATPAVDPALTAQVAPEGLIVAPVGDEHEQELTTIDARGRARRHGAVRFVPLLGRGGFAR